MKPPNFDFEILDLLLAFVIYRTGLVVTFISYMNLVAGNLFRLGLGSILPEFVTFLLISSLRFVGKRFCDLIWFLVWISSENLFKISKFRWIFR